MRTALRLALPALLAVSTPALQAQPKEPGDLWDVQMTMSMPGMPMAMPAQTSRVCAPRNGDRPPVGGRDEKCDMYDVKRSGNTHSWKMRCSGPPPSSGSGTMTYEGRDSYKGTMTVTTEGETMTMQLAGRRVGDCDYAQTRAQQSALVAEVNKRQAEGNAAMKQACDSWLQEMEPTLLSSDLCKDQRKAYCTRASTADGYGKLARQPATRRNEAAKVCGLDLAATRNTLCKRAEAQEDAPFLGAHCVVRPDDQPNAPVYAADLFKRECAGRGFTGKPVAEKYRSFCSAAIAAGMKGDGARAKVPTAKGDSAQAEEGKAQQQVPETPPPKPAEDAIKKGTDLLRGLLGR